LQSPGELQIREISVTDCKSVTSKRERNRDITLYLRVKGGKIWIEEDWLEHGIATDLVQAGIPKEDIVLAFQPPSMRPFTEFAVN